VTIYCPESPQFLLERRRFADLRVCFSRIQKINQNFDEAIVNSIVDKLEAQVACDDTLKIHKQESGELVQDDFNEASLCKNKQNRSNLIAVSILWSASGFICYLM